LDCWCGPLPAGTTKSFRLYVLSVRTKPHYEEEGGLCREVRRVTEGGA
jgi:hypothetical protein